MLGKLIKHEWKSVSKVGVILLLVIVAITAIGCVVLQTPGMTELFSEESNMSDLQRVGWVLTGILLYIVYVIMLMVVCYGIYIFFGMHFYKTMYSEQGYLTNTLPVTAHQLLISKIFVSGVWNLIIMIVLFASVLALFGAFLNNVFAATFTVENGGYRNIWEVFGMILSELKPVFEEMGFDVVHLVVIAVLLILTAPFSTMTMIFGSVTIGQLFKKHKGLMGVLTCFGVGLLTMIIQMVVQFISTMKYSMDIMGNQAATMNMNVIYDTSIIVSVVTAVILYVLSHYILTHKLNMD